MKINELVQKLIEISHEHGNIEIYANLTDYDMSPTTNLTIEVKEKEVEPWDKKDHELIPWIDDKVFINELEANKLKEMPKYVLIDW